MADIDCSDILNFLRGKKYRLLLACAKSSSLFDHLVNMTLYSDKTTLFFFSISMCFSPDSELVIYTFIPTPEETKDNHVDYRQNDTVLSSLALGFRHYGTVGRPAYVVYIYIYI